MKRKKILKILEKYHVSYDFAFAIADELQTKEVSDEKECYWFYPFWKESPNICWFKNQPHVGDECTGVGCGNWKPMDPGRNISSTDSRRMKRSSRRHDSNE